MNQDIEEDECNYIWDLDRDWSKKYFRRNNTVLYQNVEIAVEEVGNHRKQYLCEGELLIVWTNGIRLWTPMSIACECDPKMIKMISTYLIKNNLTKQIMEKCLIPATVDEIGETNKSAGVNNDLKKSDNGKLPNKENPLPYQ